MPLAYVSGDPLLTRAQAVVFGCNALGRTENSPFALSVFDQNPAAFSAYRRRCKQGTIQPGRYWLWRDSRPQLVFMAVRASAVGATRLRYVQSAVMALARDYALEGLRSLAVAPLGDRMEWPEIKPIVEAWLGRISLPVIVYEVYTPGVQADENLLMPGG
jgi:hypothetical protein